MRPPPFAYAAIDLRDGALIGVYPTLKAAAPHAPESLWGSKIEAFWADGLIKVVPRAAFRNPSPPSREEAVAFIRDRSERISIALASGQDAYASLWRAAGCIRANCDDPEEKQIVDYMASAPWKPRDDPEENWWQAPPTMESTA